MLTKEQERFLSLKEEKIASIESLCYNEVIEGFSHNGYHYGLRERDQLNYLTLLNRLDKDHSMFLPITCFDILAGEWKQVAHNYDMVDSMGDAATVHKYAVIEKQYKLLAEVQQATTEEELNKIVW